MEESRKAFLVDANTFITPYRQYYPFDIRNYLYSHYEFVR